MSLGKHDLVTTIEYPESDGEPMAETELHARLMVDLRFALWRHFRHETKVYVGINMLMYYVQGDPRQSRAPDVFVARGVSKEPMRRTWQVWKEGKAPDVIIEISSRGTWQEDLYEKWQLYARLGVREYFIFDPEYDYLPDPLMAWRLVEGQYQLMPLTNGRVLSEALGLELVDTGTTLRLHDPRTGQWLPTEEEEVTHAERETERAEREAERAEHEAERANREAERAEREAERAEHETERANRETEARQRAEAELTRLRAEVARRKRQPTKKRTK